MKQERLGAVEHAVVVERAPAAEIRARDNDSEAGGFQDFDGGFGGAGVEIIIERVGPEENGRGVQVIRRVPAMEPCFESLWGEGRDSALLGNSGNEL